MIFLSIMSILVLWVDIMDIPCQGFVTIKVRYDGCNAYPMRSRVVCPLAVAIIISKSWFGILTVKRPYQLTADAITHTGFVMKMKHVDAQQTATIWTETTHET